MDQHYSKNSQIVTDQHISFFQTFGYLAFPGLIKDCIDEIIEAFEEVWRQREYTHFDGVPHNGTKRSCIVPFPDQHPRLCQLLTDPRIDAIASVLLGDDYNFMPSDENYYVGNTGWHSDGINSDILHI